MAIARAVTRQPTARRFRISAPRRQTSTGRVLRLADFAPAENSTSTTVAIPRYDSGAVGNDTIALSIDADGAICSIPTPAPRRATPSALNAKTNAVSPPHSTRHQAPRRFEAQQTAHRRAFFFHHLQVGGPHGTQQRQRPHRQGDVTIPPRPTANLILI